MRTSIFTLVAITLMACNSPKPQNTEPVPSASPTVPAEVTPPEPVKPVLPTAELKVASVGNTMTYDVKSLTVKAGQPVHLVFVNHSTMTTMAHNWVLVASADPTVIASVAANGLKMGEQAGYVDVRDKNVLANTPMAKAGETVEVSFTAPETPGKYAGVCTFPGHYLQMHMDFIVE